MNTGVMPANFKLPVANVLQKYDHCKEIVYFTLLYTPF